jgi:hypothetical protein
MTLVPNALRLVSSVPVLCTIIAAGSFHPT